MYRNDRVSGAILMLLQKQKEAKEKFAKIDSLRVKAEGA
jgi:hypothetical protein